jgi:hypothetical protein
VFHDDGTHEPVGEHDVPWAVPIRKPRKSHQQEARA